MITNFSWRAPTAITISTVAIAFRFQKSYNLFHQKTEN